MINLNNRSGKKEILDEDNIPFADIKRNMQELNTVNRLLGGHKITLAGVEAIIASNPLVKTFTICEIGCGGGDNLDAISTYCITKKIKANFIGIDIKKECIDFARQQYPSLPAAWVTSDFAAVEIGDHKPDIIFSSLFCHHFTNEEMIKILQWMKQNSSLGFFINDLQRHTLAYYSISLLTRLFSRSYLVKNDAPLSVARGFKLNEWKKILGAAGIRNYDIRWKWAFRYLIVYKHEPGNNI